MNHFNRILLGVFNSMGVHAQNPLWIVPENQFPNINNQFYDSLPTPSIQFGTAFINQPNAPWDGYDGQEAQYVMNPSHQ